MVPDYLPNSAVRRSNEASVSRSESSILLIWRTISEPDLCAALALVSTCFSCATVTRAQAGREIPANIATKSAFALLRAFAGRVGKKALDAHEDRYL